MITEENKQDSGTVTALAVIGLIIGSIGLLGSFIPCLGALAIYIAIPAAICAGIGLYIANQKKISLTLSIVALVISSIAIVISGLQILALTSAASGLQDVSEQIKQKNIFEAAEKEAAEKEESKTE